jgi:hypothetical protein
VPGAGDQLIPGTWNGIGCCSRLLRCDPEVFAALNDEWRAADLLQPGRRSTRYPAEPIEPFRQSDEPEPGGGEDVGVVLVDDLVEVVDVVEVVGGAGGVEQSYSAGVRPRRAEYEGQAG